MHLVYGYFLDFSAKELSSNHKTYQLFEDNLLEVDKSFINYLNNNQYRLVTISSNSTFENLQKNQDIYFEVKDVVSFHAKLGSNQIRYRVYDLGNQELLKYWTYHTFLPILFTMENTYYFIHAGCVKIEDEAVLFIANSFGGKSTLTDYFLKKDHTLISDDKVGTFIKDDKVYAIPSYPYHRPYRKVEDLGYLHDNFLNSDIKIGTIYNLVKSQADCEISVKEIFGIEKFTALRYATDIDLQVNKEKRFKMISNIANQIKVYNITIPWDLDRLEEVYKTIIKHKKGQR